MRAAAAFAILFAAAGCSYDLGIYDPALQGEVEAAAHTRFELPFATEIVASRDSALVAGAGAAAWVSLGVGVEPSEIATIEAAGRGAPRAAANAGAGRGFVLWSGALDRIDAGARSELLVGGNPTAMAYDAEAGALWLAGQELVRVTGDVIDRVAIDGLQGTASAMTIGPDGRVWAAYGPSIYGVKLIDGVPDVLVIADLGLGEIHALAADGSVLIAGAENGLAIRDESWRGFSSAPVTHLASNGGRTWALIGSALAVRDGEAFAKIAGGPEGHSLSVDRDGAALVLRGAAIERWSLDRRIKVRAPAGPIAQRTALEVFADDLAHVDRIEASIDGTALPVEAGPSIIVDPAFISAGAATIEARAIYRDGSHATTSVAITSVAPPPPPPPPPPTQPISFSRDILPWARGTCSCHFSGTGGVPLLDNAAAWRQRSAIIAVRVVQQQPPVMPPPEISNRPTAAQRTLLGRWIEGSQDD